MRHIVRVGKCAIKFTCFCVCEDRARIGDLHPFVLFNTVETLRVTSFEYQCFEECFVEFPTQPIGDTDIVVNGLISIIAIKTYIGVSFFLVDSARIVDAEIPRKRIFGIKVFFGTSRSSVAFVVFKAVTRVGLGI